MEERGIGSGAVSAGEDRGESCSWASGRGTGEASEASGSCSAPGEGTLRPGRVLRLAVLAVSQSEASVAKTVNMLEVWHVDGYDKLKPFGIAISGCIDGFSRKVMWLKSGSTNNDPGIIAQNYIQCLTEFGQLPALLCSATREADRKSTRLNSSH